MHDPARRETRIGRWFPVALYLAIGMGQLIEGVLARAEDRLWLVVLTLPAPVLYIWRTRGGRG